MSSRGTWQFRRNVVIYTLLFNAFCILWVLMVGAVDAETGKTAIASSFALAGMVIGSYVFAATWNDNAGKK